MYGIIHHNMFMFIVSTISTVLIMFILFYMKRRLQNLEGTVKDQAKITQNILGMLYTMTSAGATPRHGAGAAASKAAEELAAAKAAEELAASKVAEDAAAEEAVAKAAEEAETEGTTPEADIWYRVILVVALAAVWRHSVHRAI